MRFLHKADKVPAISAYISREGLSVAECASDGSSARVVPVQAIVEMDEKSAMLWGTSLPYYLHISRPSPPHAMPLAAAVDAVEGASEPLDFLIVAYEDGGLISISGTEVPFQSPGEIASWWRPPGPRRWFSWLRR